MIKNWYFKKRRLRYDTKRLNVENKMLNALVHEICKQTWETSVVIQLFIFLFCNGDLRQWVDFPANVASIDCIQPLGFGSLTNAMCFSITKSFTQQTQFSGSGASIKHQVKRIKLHICQVKAPICSHSMALDMENLGCLPTFPYKTCVEFNICIIFAKKSRET